MILGQTKILTSRVETGAVLVDCVAQIMQASVLTRFEGNPILEPIHDHAWESKMVYNPAAIQLDGITYIVYRAFGDDHLSRLGLAWSKDGVHIDGRLPYPIFTPTTEYELPKTALQ